MIRVYVRAAEVLPVEVLVIVAGSGPPNRKIVLSRGLTGGK
jgi:hypothetical protein